MSQTLRRWLVPDIALILSAITMLYCLASFAGMQMLFRDSDTGWHIRNGERILASGAVPYTEPYSFSKPGGPWFAWEWLADVIMAQAHLWDGMRGVFFLYLLVIGLVTWLWFQLVWSTGSWFLIGSASTWVMLTTSNIHWLARPHLLGWVFLLLAMLAAEHAPRRAALHWWLGVAIGGVLWANIHGSFFLGTGIFVLYACQRWIEKDERWKPLAGFGLVSAVTSFVNPYGWHVHEHIIRYLQDTELLARIGEFQTFNFHVEGAEALVIGMIVVATGISLNVQQGQYARAVLCLIFYAGALRSARGLPLLALAGLPLALGAICESLGRVSWMRGVMQYNLNLRAMEASFRGWALVPVIVALFFVVHRSPMFAKPAGFPAETFPVVLCEQVEKLPATARIFSTDRLGGYMIYRFAGKRKVFFDGRSDYYGAAFLKDYLLIPDLKPGWEEKFRVWNFTHALLPLETPLIEMLKLRGWKEIGKDATSILLEKSAQ